MSRFLTAATLVTAVRALAFDGKPARATDVVVPDATFHLPEITQAPNVRELFKRQSNGDQVVLIGPDNTCGYVSGRAGAPITCNNDYTCAFVYDDSYGRAGCCQGDDCGIRNTCLDYDQVYSTSLCDNGCLQDTYTVKCTEASAPYCATLTWFSGVIDFLCADRAVSTPQQLYTTYIGESDGRSFETFTVSATDSASDDGSAFDSATDDGSFFLPITSSDTSFSTATSSRTSSSSGTSGGNSGSSGSDNDSSSNNNSGGSSQKSSTPIGPIVGGVVGGVGGLALIGLGIFFIVRHNNKKKSAALNPGQPMEQTAAGGGMSPPPPGAPGYPPQAYNQQQYQQPYQQQPYQQQSTPPQAYYPPQEQKPAGFVTLSPGTVPDRHDSTSPVSQFSDARHSVQPQSPTSTLNSNWGPQPGQQAPLNVPPTVHEAGGNVVGETDYNANHRGQFHEMG
ncbi:hypothetical protein E0Z10_g9285 [Xylaria hypoxylon]|uniref:Mid2 domain-containing protein n=1 Tax=Xylaria hypoxylon TaxID=37992 RepID=A0A4Z0YLE8_9PEZI|nr:hypothetical protein E0Z10_g9285 [Xylaria hypoxylon]